MFDRISMVGLGYIGLPTAAVFAARGVEVIGLDLSRDVVETVNAGKVHIVEPDLDGIVFKAVTDGKLRATLKPEPADAYLIAVPTPFTGNHEPDLRHVESAARMIAPVLSPGNLIVLESTSPVGATEQLARCLADARPDLSFPQSAGDEAEVQIAYCPERVLPGHVVRELVENDRIIGGLSSRASEMAVALYEKVVEGECIVTDARTAEMCKLTENSFRDVQIAFANELSIISEKLDIDVWELIRLANRHPRVDILQPGAGVGGHCIAVDPWFIISSAPDDAKLISTARKQNENKPAWVFEKSKAAILEVLAREPALSMADIKVACLGLAFKPDIDDLRESPALQIALELSKLGCQVLAVEPHINELPQCLRNGNVTLVELERATTEAHATCILVKHTAFAGFAESFANCRPLIDVVGL